MAWLFLPENELPQWQQKIASQKILLVHLNELGSDGFSARSAIFCRYWTCSFSGQVSAIEARDAAIFTRIKEVFRAFSTPFVGAVFFENYTNADATDLDDSSKKMKHSLLSRISEFENFLA